LINAEPGTVFTASQREACRNWPSQTEVIVKALHFIQQDSTEEIGQTVAAWLKSI
jgi:haloalkane dehalogenase